MSASYTLDSNVLTLHFAFRLLLDGKPTIREIIHQAFTEVQWDMSSKRLIKQEAKELVQWLHPTSGAAKKFNKHWAFYLATARKAGLAWWATDDELMAKDLKAADPFQCGQFIPLTLVESEIASAEVMNDFTEYECEGCNCRICERWM